MSRMLPLKKVYVRARGVLSRKPPFFFLAPLRSEKSFKTDEVNFVIWLFCFVNLTGLTASARKFTSLSNSYIRRFFFILFFSLFSEEESPLFLADRPLNATAIETPCAITFPRCDAARAWSHMWKAMKVRTINCFLLQRKRSWGSPIYSQNHHQNDHQNLNTLFECHFVWKCTEVSEKDQNVQIAISLLWLQS